MRKAARPQSTKAYLQTPELLLQLVCGLALVVDPELRLPLPHQLKLSELLLQPLRFVLLLPQLRSLLAVFVL